MFVLTIIMEAHLWSFRVVGE